MDRPGHTHRSTDTSDGTVYRRRTQGDWGAKLRFPDGTWKYASARTKALAREKLAELRRRRDAGLLAHTPKQTVSAAITDWITTVATPTRRPESVRTYTKMAKLVTRHLGDRQLASLTAADVERLQADLCRSYAPRTVIAAISLLRMVLRRAVTHGVLARNPADGIDPPETHPPRKRALTDRQAAQLLATTESDELYLLWLLQLTYGLRTSEALGLTWDDVDEHTITVNHQLRYAPESGFYLGPPKTSSSRRTFRISPHTRDALAAHRAEQASRRLLLGPEWLDNNLILDRGRGEPWVPGSIGYRLKVACRRAGIPAVSPHELRHTAITIRLDHAQRVDRVAAVVGHKSTATTLDVYTHARDDDLASDATQMDEILGRGVKPGVKGR